MTVSVFLMIKRVSAHQHFSKNESETDANHINSLSHIHILLAKTEIMMEQGTPKNTTTTPQV